MNTSVFPAFNDSYRTRKRTFRCCKKCRIKRVRCMVLDPNYDICGCDNCKRRGIVCDFTIKSATSGKFSEEVDFQENADVPEKAPTNGANVDAAGTQPGDPRPDLGKLSKHFALMPTVPLKQPPQPYHVTAFATHGPSEAANFHFSTGSEVLFNGRLPPFSESSLVSGRGPASDLSTDVPKIFKMPDVWDINHIDHTFLKRHFDFNITYRQSRYFFSKLLSRRTEEKRSFEPVPEHVAKKHLQKPKYLDSSNTLHFNFLLSIHAFTLNTPGFYEISSSDLVKLFEIYFFKVNSVFPIVFEAEFWELHNRNKIPNVILYAVVLNAARDELAEPILARSFVRNGASFRENHVRFLKELDMKTRQLLDFLPELGDTEKLARLITLLLLSLCFKFNKFGNEQSSKDIGDCIGLAYSLLIHHDFFHVRIAEAGASKKSKYLKKVWWILFIFDRFNALLNGKAMYIKRLDFNISRPTDLPHLDRLVSLAYTLEDTIIAVFRPQQKLNSKRSVTTVSTELTAGDPEFNPTEVIQRASSFLNDWQKSKSVLSGYKKMARQSSDHLPNLSIDTYSDRIVYFLEVLIYHQIIVILRTGGTSGQEDFAKIEDISIRLGERVFENFTLLKDGLGHKLVMSTPVIPLMLLVAFSVPMTARLNMSKCAGGTTRATSKERSKLVSLGDAYLSELKQFSEKWWFIHEVVVALEEFLKPTRPDLKRERNSVVSPTPLKRSKLSIDSLVTDVTDAESVLPSLPSITSPGYYDDVIKKEESDDEVASEEAGAEQRGEYNGEIAQNGIERDLASSMAAHTNHLPHSLQPFDSLSLGDIGFEFPDKLHVFGDSGPFQEESQSTKGSISSTDDVNFDVAHLAEVVNTEANFIPNVMDFFNEQNYDFLV